jgi:Zn-dependent protease
MLHSTWRLGAWRGIPISLHWTVLIGLPWFLYRTRSVTDTAVSFAAFFVLLLAHELGHAAVATWRHVDVHRIELLFLHGFCVHDQPYQEEDDVLIAWGGVATQFVVLIAALAFDLLLGPRSPYTHPVTFSLLRVLIDTNLVIMIINLIPVAPLDGAKAWRCIPIAREWVKRTSWATNLRTLLAARQRTRNEKIEAKSAKITADIVEKLKKRKRDV